MKKKRNPEVYDVGKLKEALKNVPDDTPVMYQRIEDVYFQTHGWTTVTLPWDFDSSTEYIQSWWAGYLEKDKIFVIEAHY